MNWFPKARTAPGVVPTIAHGCDHQPPPRLGHPAHAVWWASEAAGDLVRPLEIDAIEARGAAAIAPMHVEQTHVHTVQVRWPHERRLHGVVNERVPIAETLSQGSHGVHALPIGRVDHMHVRRSCLRPLLGGRHVRAHAYRPAVESTAA